MATETTYTFTDVATPAAAATDGFTVTFNKRNGSTNPAWNATNSEARLYAKGSLVISGGESNTITKIVFDYVVNANSKGKTPTIDGVAGTTNAGTWDADNKTWSDATGDTEITFATSGDAGNVGFKSITITYTAAAAPAVAAPKILGEESFKESTSVNITCDTQGATIYYTLDGTDPTAESTEFTAAITLTETKTVKAIAIKGEDASEVASKTFTKLEPMTCAEVYSKAKNAAIYLNDVTVTYVNGKNVYVKDATGAMLLYLPSADAAEWAAGDVLSGVEGALDIYNGLYEVKPSDDQVAAVTATAGTAPEPIEFTAAPVAADMNKYVVLKNVSVSAASFPDNKNMDATIGEQTFILRNSFNANIAFDTEKTYDITGVVAVYNDNVQVYFISAEEVVDPRMAGTYNIGGENADYATLSAAAADLRAKGLKGDVTLLICADIAEVANVGLVNETDYTITIAPNAAAKRTISFGDVPDNVGPSGHIMIGYDMAAWASTATKNIVIDGSYEGEGQYLEFQAGTVGGVVVVFYGKVSNSVVKNCRLINHRTTKTNYVAQFRTEQGAGSSKTNFGPSNVGFENCYMEVNKVANTQAIYYNGSTAATDAGLPKDCYVLGCEIVSNLRGIFFNGAMNAVIEGNTFRMASASGGFLAHGIMGNVQKGTIAVRGNKFIELGTMNTSPNEYGICGITASGGADVWVIENNYFAGLDSKADVSGKIVTLRYVRCGDSCVVRHNTFYLPAQTYKPATDLVASQAVTCLWLAGAKAYPVENNIFVSAETVAKNSLIRGALNANVKNNVFFHNGGEAAILAGAVIAADWTAFSALEGTAGSKWKLPVFTNAAEGKLDITTADADLLMPRLEDILKDITGADRRENTYAGAFEGPEVSPATAIDAVKVEGIQKIFRNGEVLIIRDGKTYNMMGQIVE